MLLVIRLRDWSPVASTVLRAPLTLPPCSDCAGGGEVNGIPCRGCGGKGRAGMRVRVPWRMAGRRIALAAAGVAGTAVGWSRLAPSLAGAAMVSLGASMVYTPAGVVIGGAFLLWIGTELQGQ